MLLTAALTAYGLYYLAVPDHLAQNCWNVSVYVKDARAQELPLVGGGEHDWTYLLEQLGLLEQDQAVGTAVRVAGTLIFVYAALRGYAYARSSEGPLRHPAKQ